ncbi:YceI family protein [Nocardia sp. NPDC059091]|uniref:YceI family protein n=1 Tax=unclassified Nocardia TaxID=2637762 RepID=UPI0036B73F52
MSTNKLSELTGDYVLDPAHTRIGFIARHTMATRVRGNFRTFDGNAHLDFDAPPRSSGRLTIQAKSIDTGNRQRDDLLGRKFLGVDDHPTITFVLTEVEQSGEANVEVTGDLTMRGITRPITMEFELTGAETDPRGALRIDFTGSVTIDRKDWGVHWKAAAGMVGPKVVLQFDVAVIRKS